MANPTPMPWAILLCKYKDDPNDPTKTRISDLAAQWRLQKDATFIAANLSPAWDTDDRTIMDLYETFFTITGLFTFNSVRYWDEMSHGRIYTGDSRVFPCTLDRTASEGAALSISPGGAAYQNDTFAKAKEALNQQYGVDWRDFNGGVAVSFQSPEFAAQGGWFDGGPGVWMDIRWVKNNGIQAWGQEMGHAFGLDHSRTDGDLDANGVGVDYTDPWDVMSTQVAFSAADTSYGMRGPGLNAWNMRSRQWLDESRVWRGPSQGFSELIVRLRPLHKRYLPGLLAAELPGIGGNLSTSPEYLVEFRVPDEWDAGIGAPKLLIHRFEGKINQFMGTHSYLMKGTNGQKALAVGDVFEIGAGPFLRLKVLEVDDAKLQADIQLCYSTKAKLVPSVKIVGGPASDFITGRDLRGRCNPQNIEGTPFWFRFEISHTCMPNYQILWSVTGGIAPYQKNESLFLVYLPSAGVETAVSLSIVFDDGVVVQDSYRLLSISQQQADWIHFLCSLSDARMEPIPWWRWNPRDISTIAGRYSKQELRTVLARAQDLTKTLRHLLER